MPRDEFVSRDTLRRQKQRRTGLTVMACGWIALLILVAAIVRCSLRDAEAAEPLRTFADDGLVCACYADDAAACVRFDKPEELGLEYLKQYLLSESTDLTEPWDECKQARCYGDVAAISKACEHWVVAGRLLGKDRPLYACDDKCVKDRKRGKEIGRTGKDGEAACEGQLSPPWLSGNDQIQFTENAGKRGVALCEEAK